MFIFAFVAFAFVIKFDRSLLGPKTNVKELAFFQELYGFRSLIHFQFIFVYGVLTQFHSSACDYPVFPTPFIHLFIVNSQLKSLY